MGIPNMSEKVSSSDLNRMKNRHNPPDNDPDFSGGDDMGDDDDFFGDDSSGDNPFGGSGDSGGSGGLGGSNPFGSPGGSSNPFGSPGGGLGGGNPFGSPGGGLGGGNPFGSPGGGLGGNPFGSPGGFSPPGSPFGSPGGGFGQPNQQQQQTSEWTDKAANGIIGFFGNAFKEMWELIKDAWKSLKVRTVDDWALYSSMSLRVALGVFVTGLALGVLGLVYKTNMLSFLNLPTSLLSVGMIIGGTGLIGIGASTACALKDGNVMNATVASLDDLPTEMETTQEEYEDKAGDLFSASFDLPSDDDDDFFKDDDDDFFSDDEDDADDFFGDSSSTDNDVFESVEEEEKVDISSKPVEGYSENLAPVPVMSREVLMNNLLPLFPEISPKFYEVKSVDPDSDEFLSVETLAMKALCNAANKDEDELDIVLESLKKSEYSMELKIKRIRGMNKLDKIEEEMVSYFRSSVSDDSVQCKVDIDGDFYKIIISFGNSDIVSIKDVLQTPEGDKYFRDKSHALPFIVCLDDLGKPMFADAKTIDTMLIAGKPRSGKSWFVLSILTSLMAFNSPEEIQFLIIDPKESNLFKELSMMPHVCGLHNDSNVNTVLRDLINHEGARRKKILADNRCENIWDLRKKGVVIPVLYIVIDEVMTIMGNLGDNFKEFLSLISTVVTQLPSQGIRLIMVPHRSKGVIQPSIRTNITFTAAIRADTEIIKETLDIPKWNRPLLQPGELAVKMTGVPTAKFGRSVAVTASDMTNSDLILELARSFYKMGFEMPDMSTVGCGFNRDEEHIKEELTRGANKYMQFDPNSVSDADDDINLDDYT